MSNLSCSIVNAGAAAYQKAKIENKNLWETIREYPFTDLSKNGDRPEDVMRKWICEWEREHMEELQKNDPTALDRAKMQIFSIGRILNVRLTVIEPVLANTLLDSMNSKNAPLVSGCAVLEVGVVY